MHTWNYLAKNRSNHSNAYKPNYSDTQRLRTSLPFAQPARASLTVIQDYSQDPIAVRLAAVGTVNPETTNERSPTCYDVVACLGSLRSCLSLTADTARRKEACRVGSAWGVYGVTLGG